MGHIVKDKKLQVHEKKKKSTKWNYSDIFGKK